jgi:hypothetical protein
MRFLRGMLEALFGCWHPEYSRVYSDRNDRNHVIRGRCLDCESEHPRQYVYCLKCGATLDYCWNTMRTFGVRERTASQPDAVAEWRRA